ncbi:thiol reductant ABC exporter subunit CydC [Bordetella bronchiseptica]|uniref:Probable ATP-binding component of ABC transporter n=52 Tax=Alcaligenaceae TaxID=506 RepID=A0A0H3LSN8_BORBR|nr:thiol reductant ABC exporter subunit CydC [Bordetella bronchiseptica]KAK66550.1 thiol reductant ABC exporter, CydC subunit [Bordetella bronchiseptica 980-2]AMG90458.1 thiol reductant ABC exporter subunit CydC [Bordetella bronchiseptica]KCV47575.1 thiol reductant ABC exporter, CydC subunit [Bordetella bronchiseptica 3E44]KCV64309.1 thiol reductant ABC exporter, CydC subunit [Bordetella bronchiseptica 980]KDB82950.1 thiol reductant ABC exporter, CydC subunit [Bordetella bronchiseptica D756]
MSLWRLLFRLYARRKGALALALALSLLTVAAGVGLLGVSGWFLTGAALAGAGAVFNLFVPSSLVRGLSFIRIASRYGERLAGHAATLRLLADLRASVFRSLVRLTPRQLARYRGGDLVARLTSDVDALDTVFLFVLAPVAVALAGGAILTAVMGAWIPAAALVVAAALLLCCAVAPWWLARAGRRPGAAVQESAAALRAATLDAVEGHADIAALHAGAQARAQFADACEQSARARAAQVRIAARGQWLAQLAAGAAVLAVLWFGLDGLAAGELGGPLLAGLLLATIGIFEVAGPVMRGVSRLGAAVAAAARIGEIAARIGEIAAREPDLRDPAAPRALPPAGELALEDVTFAYPVPDAAAHPVLDGASLRVAPGQRVAIVGASGAGKSTVLQLLLRLEDPQRGAVRYAGCDVRECAQAELHRRVALLSQDAPLFLGTVRTNLLIGDAQAGDAALWRALDAARLGEVVRGLPHGLDTWIGETGAGLSAGQARRLCLARALLTGASAILLDEPTAGLDAATEAELLADLARATQGRTVVLATHARLPPGTVDTVYTLQAGRLHRAAPM